MAVGSDEREQPSEGPVQVTVGEDGSFRLDSAPERTTLRLQGMVDPAVSRFNSHVRVTVQIIADNAEAIYEVTGWDEVREFLCRRIGIDIVIPET